MSKTTLTHYAKNNNLAKIVHGIYFCDDYLKDQYYIFSLRYKNMIFSHKTTLYLLGLSDREPTILNVTAKDKYNCTSIKNRVRKYIALEKSCLRLDKTPMGNEVSVYDANTVYTTSMTQFMSSIV